MNKGILLIILILPVLLFSETYYVIGNTVYRGYNKIDQKNFEVVTVLPEKVLNDESDKRVIIMSDETENLIDENFLKSGNIDFSDIRVVNDNFVYSKRKESMYYTKTHTFSYFMPKDYKYWKIGGRREDINKMELSTLENTIWYRIHKTGYSENNLYKDFEMPFGINTFVDFSAEMAGLVAKSKILPEETYSLAGVIFLFLDSNKKDIDKISFVWSSSEHPFKEYFWINPIPLNNSKNFHIAFNVKDITENNNVKYLRVVFWTFGSDKYKTLTADLFIRNVEITISKSKN
ncbi:hypothetical protein JCM30566_05230 [Marinitoga arctica]